MKSPIARSDLDTLAAFAEALLPDVGLLPAAEKTVPVADAIHSFLCETPPHLAGSPRVIKQVRLALKVFERTPLLHGQPRRFSELSLPARQRHLLAMERSRISVARDLFLLLKALCSLAYCSDERVQKAIGYRARCALRDGGELPPGRPSLDGTRLRPVQQDRQFDVVIVGSGAGGATAALRLATAGLDVAVVEEGSYYSAATFRRDPTYMLPRLYREQGMTALKGRPAIPLPVGRCVGGTTVINSGTCFRAPTDVLDLWRSQYGVQWASPASLDPIYAWLERELLIEPVDPTTMGGNGRACMAGALKIGAHGGPISRYADGCVQCSSCPTGCAIDAKQAMHVSFLPQAVAAGAELFVDSRVERLLRRNGQVYGVEVVPAGPEGSKSSYRLRAKAVVLAGGALGTPEILLRSGFGESHGQVGKNLRVHPACWVGGLYDREIRGWDGIMQSYYVDQWHDEGLLIEAIFTPLPFAGHWLPGAGPKYVERLAGCANVASFGVHLSDRSSGRVRLNGRGDTELTYKLERDDVRTFVKGIKRVADIHFAAGAKEVYPHIGRLGILRPGEQDRLERSRVAAHHLRLEAFHPMGTARMGRDRQQAVTDASGRVHDIDGLYVADASLFPTSVGANPMLTIMAASSWIADRLATDLGQSG